VSVVSRWRQRLPLSLQFGAVALIYMALAAALTLLLSDWLADRWIAALLAVSRPAQLVEYEVGRGECRRFRQQRRALDGVAQFAHVAWPAMREQRALGVGGELLARGQEMAGQRQDVVAAFSQRR
jgi:hypothetical protein